MTTTSREYAEALFELAAQEDCLKETQDGLVTVISALRQTPAYADLLSSPAIGKEERIAALNQAFEGVVPRELMGVLRMMVSRGHVREVEAMAREYRELAMHSLGESIAEVTSAVELKEAEAVALRARLEKKFNRTVILHCKVDPSIIGGIRVEIDGRVIDGSIRNKLQEIKEVMKA